METTSTEVADSLPSLSGVARELLGEAPAETTTNDPPPLTRQLSHDPQVK